MFFLVFTAFSMISLNGHAWGSEATDEKVNAKKRLVQISGIIDGIIKENQNKGKKKSLDFSSPEGWLGHFSQCLDYEKVFEGIRRETILPWEESWKGADPGSFFKLAGKEFVLSFPELNFKKPQRSDDGIEEYEMTKQRILGAKDRSKQNELLKKYLTEFKEIKSMDLTILRNKVKRDANGTVSKVELEGQFELRGIPRENGQRRSDRGQVKMVLDKSDGGLKLVKVEFSGWKTLLSRKPPSFIELTQTGLEKAPVSLRQEAIRRGGFALAVSDYDNDGLVDMFIGGFGEATLWKGVKGGTFVQDTKSGIGPHNMVKSATFSDFDNDGDKDLVLVRFTQRPKDLGWLEESQPHGDVIYYENMGNGKFKEIGNAFGKREQVDYAMPSAVADFNNDGFLDFYVGFPGKMDFTVFEERDYSSNKVVPQGLFFYTKKNRFQDESKRLAMDVSSNQRNNLFPHSALAFDYDSDGKMDILVMDDKKNLSPFYRNNGSGNFDQISDYIRVENRGWGMGVAVGDLFNEGKLDILMTNITFNVHQRFQDECKEILRHLNVAELNGLKKFINNRNGKFEEKAIEGLDLVGEGAAGVEIIDYNNDGHQDIYVSNGLWSGMSKKTDISSLFSMWALAILQNPALREEEMSKSSFLEILRHYQGDTLTFEEGKERPSMGGFQHNRLFKNRGDGTFVEVGFLEGVDSLADGYMIAKSDLNGDGKMDLILRNTDPGTTENQYSAVQVFLNNHSNDNSISVRLKGKRSNMDAIGARVVATINGKRQEQQLLSTNGAVQSEYLLIFGLGKNKKADKIEIFWPSGSRHVQENVLPGKYLFTESENLISQQ